MTIHVHRVNGSTFELVNGFHRFRAQLALSGKARVLDPETGESFEVHEVDGQIVALDSGNGAIAETVAAAAIAHAARL